MVSPLVATRAQLRTVHGRVTELNVDRWLSEADDADLRLLDRAIGPVLDVGCGPGRHVEALSQRGTEVLGMDLSPEFVAVAQGCGRPVHLQSVFDPIPGGPRWRCALLLDGSIGVGGDPEALLRRVADLLEPHGQALVETGAPTEPSEPMDLFIESPSDVGTWFAWATLSAVDAASVAQATGFRLSDLWEDSGRWFAQLDKG
jgi:SAM-dependent methyltransferase